MRRANELEQRLTEWGKEYGGGRYEDNGWHGISPLATIMKYHGRPPQGLNPRRVSVSGVADEVDAAVRKMEQGPEGYRLAQVLRMEYLHPGKPFESKTQRLREVGIAVTRSRYDDALERARACVGAILGIRQEKAA